METEASAVDDAGRAGGLIGSARPIGAVLAAARTARGLDLTDVARETRVPVRHLAAIEADQHDALPALPYAIGFVRAFARAVGIDGDAAAAAFRAETSKAAHVPAQPTMTPLDERRLPPRGLVVASVAALIGVGALVVAWSDGAFDPAPPAASVDVAAALPPAAVPRVTTAPSAAASPTSAGGAATGAASAVPAAGTPIAASPAAGTATTPAAGPAATPAPPPAVGAATVVASSAASATGGVVITANDYAWFRITVYDPAAGKVVTVKTGVLAKGERYAPPPRPGMRLWTGRAGALAITVDGRAIPALGGPVETVKNVSLDAADLRARLAAPAALPAASTR